MEAEDYRTATWLDRKGRVVLVHTMSTKWLRCICKLFKDAPEKIPTVRAELKRRKLLRKPKSHKRETEYSYWK